MIPPSIELWRSRLQGSDQIHPEIQRSAFFREVLTELNDVSYLFERILAGKIDDFTVIREEIGRLGRTKPTGSAPDPDICVRCGKKFP